MPTVSCPKTDLSEIGFSRSTCDHLVIYVMDCLNWKIYITFIDHDQNTLLITTGGAVYILRENIRDNVAGEVSTVATRSMSDVTVQHKAHELSKALLQEMLTDDNIRRYAGKQNPQEFGFEHTKDLSIF